MVKPGLVRLATDACDSFLQALEARQLWDVSVVLEQVLNWDGVMIGTEKLAEIDQLKGWLDEFRSLPAAVVAELKALFDVRVTFNSNAIEENTLSQREMQLLLDGG